MQRRQFVKLSATVAGGLAVGVSLSGCEVPPFPAAREGAFQPNVYIQFLPDNSILFQIFRAEVGQGVSTALPMVFAEELELDPAQIDIEFSGVHPDFNDASMPTMITGGSASIAGSWDALRNAGAATRQLFVNAAAQQWGVAASDCYAEDGHILARGGNKRASFGELAAFASTLSMPENVPLKAVADFKVIGQPLDRVDLRAKVSGQCDYSMDVQLDAALVAVVVRNPEIGGGLKAFNAAAALELAGVKKIFAIPTGVAVVADSYWHATKAAEKVDVEWQHGPLAEFSTAGMQAEMQGLKVDGKAKTIRNDVLEQSATGQVDGHLKTANSSIEAEYYAPHLAHGQLEPTNCLVWMHNGECDVWLANQGPDQCQTLAAKLLGLGKDKVHIHSTWVGSSFGRRLNYDYLEENLKIAQVLADLDSGRQSGTDKGIAVRLMWSREDDTRHDFYRPAMLGVLRADIADGEVLAWSHNIIGPSLSQFQMPLMIRGAAPRWIPNVVGDLVGDFMAPSDFSSVEGADDMPYSFPAVKVDYTLQELDIPIGYWRSVGHSHSGFVVESFIDEIAHAVSADPVEFRRLRLQDKPRHLAVLELVADKAGWGKALPEGHVHGVAVHEAFNTVVAEVAEVSVENGEIRVHKVIAAVHCGQVVNPMIVKQQIEGGILVALAQALFSEITFANGQVQQSNFHDYRVVRMNESPAIDVHIVPSTDAPTGVGEPGTPPLAPAVANAVFAATGQRLRKLPLQLA